MAFGGLWLRSSPAKASSSTPPFRCCRRPPCGRPPRAPPTTFPATSATGQSTRAPTLLSHRSSPIRRLSHGRPPSHGQPRTCSSCACSVSNFQSPPSTAEQYTEQRKSPALSKNKIKGGKTEVAPSKIILHFEGLQLDYLSWRCGDLVDLQGAEGLALMDILKRP